MSMLLVNMSQLDFFFPISQQLLRMMNPIGFPKYYSGLDRVGIQRDSEPLASTKTHIYLLSEDLFSTCLCSVGKSQKERDMWAFFWTDKSSKCSHILSLKMLWKVDYVSAGVMMENGNEGNCATEPLGVTYFNKLFFSQRLLRLLFQVRRWA